MLSTTYLIKARKANIAKNNFAICFIEDISAKNIFV